MSRVHTVLLDNVAKYACPPNFSSAYQEAHHRLVQYAGLSGLIVYMAKQTLTVSQALVLAKSHAVNGEVETARKLYSMVLAKFPMHKKAKEGLKAIENNVAQKTRSDLKPLIDRLIALYSSGKLKDLDLNKHLPFYGPPW